MFRAGHSDFRDDVGGVCGEAFNGAIAGPRRRNAQANGKSVGLGHAQRRGR